MMIVLLLVSGKAFADVDLTVGDVRLVITDYNGFISLYRKGETDEFISVFDPNSFSSASAFYVLLDQKVYKLSEDSSFTIESSFEENVATMVCTLENKVSVSVMWTIFSSAEENPEDSVQIAVEFVNLDDVPHLIGFKAVFDTRLGENSGIHFTTALRDELDTEYYFTNMDEDLWIRSGNEDVSMNFLLSGDEITAPQSIAVANKNVFSNLSWAPPLSVGRNFNSLQSYNNSALAVTWQPVILEPDSSNEVKFFMSTATGSDYPADINFMRNNSALDYFIDGYPELPDSALDYFVDANSEASLLTDAEILPSADSQVAPSPVLPDNTEEIRMLLDFINGIIQELEANSSSVSREEMLMINAEIDIIMGAVGW